MTLTRFYVLRYPRSWVVWDRSAKRAASGCLRNPDRAQELALKLNQERTKRCAACGRAEPEGDCCINAG